MFRRIVWLGLAALTSGCIAQSEIQGKYAKSQNLCREESARLAGAAGNQAAVGGMFSACMNKAGWHVATPQTGVVAANPPTGSPSTNPSAATAVAGSPPAAPGAAANPPSGAPSVKPSAATSSPPAAPPVATYQPARPGVSSAPDYGTGGGRNF